MIWCFQYCTESIKKHESMKAWNQYCKHSSKPKLIPIVFYIVVPCFWLDVCMLVDGMHRIRIHTHFIPKEQLKLAFHFHIFILGLCWGSVAWVTVQRSSSLTHIWSCVWCSVHPVYCLKKATFSSSFLKAGHSSKLLLIGCPSQTAELCAWDDHIKDLCSYCYDTVQQ